MVRQVPETPGLPSPPRGLPITITTWAGDLIRVLSGILAEGNIRLNRVLPKDGTERMVAALPLLTTTDTPDTKPTASENEGNIIYVSDGGEEGEFQGSNGTSYALLGGVGSIAFQARNSAGTSFGAGPTDVPFVTEVFDPSNSYASPNFTAPRTGKYRLSVLLLKQAGTVNDSWVITIVTSNRNYSRVEFFDHTSQQSVGFSVLADMEKDDIAKVTIERNAGTGTFDLTSNADFNIFDGEWIGE